jgi:CRP-like cAMP-binding protein
VEESRLENQIRLTGYRKSLERLMLLQKQQDNNSNSAIVRDSPEISALRRQYSIVPQEEAWINDRNPLIQTACLYIIAQLDLDRSQAISPNYTTTTNSPLLKATAQTIQAATNDCPPLIEFPLLEKVVYLFNSDFFHRLNSETLIALADRSDVRTFTTNGVITEAGDTCRELLLLIEGDASIHFYLNHEQVQIATIYPGQTLDELEILANSDSENTIVADSEITRILAVPVAAFDDLLDRDPDFARRVLELESRHLQKFMRSIQPIQA